MALLAPQAVSQTGLTPVYTAVNSSDTFVGGDNIFLHVKVGGTASTVTIASPTTTFCALGASGTAHQISVGPLTSTERMIGPMTPGRFNDPSTGVATVSYSAVTGVTAALLQF
jgi:hypothetical protein